MKRFLAIAFAASMVFIGPVAAQSVPPPLVQEVLIKTTLLTFNDANITGIYDVMLAKASKPFRDKFSPQNLKDGFRAFAGRHIDVIAAMPTVPTADAKIDDGVLELRGYFDTTPGRLTYTLNFAVSEDDWKLYRISVKVLSGRPAMPAPPISWRRSGIDACAGSDAARAARGRTPC